MKNITDYSDLDLVTLLKKAHKLGLQTSGMEGYGPGDSSIYRFANEIKELLSAMIAERKFF